MEYSGTNGTDEVDPAGRSAGIRHARSLLSARLLLELSNRNLQVDGIAVTLRGDEFDSHVLFASGPVVDRLGDLEFVVGEGPSVDQWSRALALADVAVSEVLGTFADATGGPQDLDGWASEARPSLVPQATGMIAVQRGIAVAQALLDLRGAAYAADRPVTELAADVVERRVSFAT